MRKNWKKTAALIISLTLASGANTTVFADSISDNKELILEGNEQVSQVPEEPTPEPVETVTPEPTEIPVEEPTPEPTEEVTPEPTSEVTPEPTEAVTPEPTKEATPEPTKEATPEPAAEAGSASAGDPAADPTPGPTEDLAKTGVPDKALNAWNKEAALSDEVRERVVSGEIIVSEVNEEEYSGIRLINASTLIPVDPETGLDFECALNADKQSAVICAEVLLLIQDGKAFRDKDGYILSADKKYIIDPETGEKTEVSGSKSQDKNKDDKTKEYVPDEQELAGLSADGSNEELINSVTIVTPPQIEEDFRFFTVARVFAFAEGKVFIKDGKRSDANDIGRMSKYDVCFILEDMNDGWVYVESGRVRGFVEKNRLLTEEKSSKLNELYMKIVSYTLEKDGGFGDLYAEELVPYNENGAFSYLKNTTGVTIAGKRCSLAKEDNTHIYEETSEGSRVVGTLPKEGRCYILKSAGDGWVFAESGDVRGFVKKSSLMMYDDKDVSEYIKGRGEESFPLASQSVKPAENRALYYSLASVTPASNKGHVRKAMIEYASQFLGNPYVWGGTSLTNGCDCSGFCQQIYAAFGYSLPRVSADQAYAGTKIPVSEALPGDLVFYARNGQIFHVAMSTGNGGTIEAMNSQNGIVNSQVAEAYAVWAVRLIDDDADAVSYNAAPSKADESETGELLGTFKVSAFSPNADSEVEYTGVKSPDEVLRQGNTAAADPDIIPYGTRFIMNGSEYVSTDCGVKVKGKKIIVFTNNMYERDAFGSGKTEVYAVKN